MTYYSIQQVSEMTQIPATTLRYYDKQGLLPFLERSEAGYRVFQKKDLGSLQIIQCLKSAGLSIVEIRQFFQWAQEGDTSLKERLNLFLKRREEVQRQMAELQKTLDVINFKCDYYTKAVAAGTEKVVADNQKLPHSDEFIAGQPPLSAAQQPQAPAQSY